MLSLRTGDAVAAVLCDQRFTFTLAWSSGAALLRRRGRCEAVDEDGAWTWCVAVWGFSALLAALALALALASPSFSESEAERCGWTVTTELLLREPARDCLRRCCVGALMLRAVRLLRCFRPSRG
jgi:hypothetical protein